MQETIISMSERYCIPSALIRAIIEVESGGNPFAMKYENNYQWLYDVERLAREHRLSLETERVAQKTSWGLMQVTGATAREMGFSGRYLSELCLPDRGIGYGCKYLKGQYSRYQSWQDAIAAYNCGHVQKRAGNYINQRYVEQVIGIWRNIK